MLMRSCYKPNLSPRAKPSPTPRATLAITLGLTTPLSPPWTPAGRSETLRRRNVLTQSIGDLARSIGDLARSIGDLARSSGDGSSIQPRCARNRPCSTIILLPCHSRCGTIKIPLCSKALSAEHRHKFCSPSPATVTSPYK
jgi:hypothetical protein